MARSSLRPLVLGALLVLLGAAPRTGHSAPSGPLVFPDGDIELGVAKQHDELVATATIRNDGTRTLTKLRTLSDCGCYSAQVSTKTLAPSAEAKVTLRFRTLSFSGPMSKKLRVAYKDDGRRIATVRVKVSVVDGVVVRPGRLHFGQVDADARPEGFVSVVWYEGVGKPFQIRTVDVPNAHVKTVVTPHEDPQRPRWKGWQIAVQFVEPPPRGVFRREAVVHTTSKEQPTVTVPISAHVVGKVWVQSDRMYLGLVPVGVARSARIHFRPARKDVKFGTVRAQSAKGLLEATVAPVPNAREPGTWQLEVSVPASAGAGPVDDDVTLHTGVPGEPTTTIRVTGRVYRPR